MDLYKNRHAGDARRCMAPVGDSLCGEPSRHLVSLVCQSTEGHLGILASCPEHLDVLKEPEAFGTCLVCEQAGQEGVAMSVTRVRDLPDLT